MQLSLEQQADKLLEEAGYINHQHGRRNSGDFYTELQLRDHRRREMTNYELGIDLLGVARAEMDDLLREETEKLCKLAQLSEVEECILYRSFIEMLSPEEIAPILDGDYQPFQVRGILNTARVKVLRTMVLYPWWGWWEVYWSEVNRD